MNFNPFRETPRKPNGDRPLMSRRNFLLSGAAAAGLALGGKVVKEFLPAEREVTLGHEGVNPTLEFIGAEEKNAVLEQTIQTLTEVADEFEALYEKPLDRPLGEIPTARDWGLARGARNIAKVAIDEIVQCVHEWDRSTYFNAIEKQLSRCACQGLLYRAYEDWRQGKPASQAPRIGRNAYYYAAYVEDVAPSTETITNEDIDQRLYAKRTRILPGDTSLRARLAVDLYQYPDWADEDHQAYFRKLIENDRIRAMAIDERLTLAEYYSLLKAIGNAQEQKDKSLTTIDAESWAKDILRKRRESMRVEVLSQDTETVILFQGIDTSSRPGRDLFASTGWDDVCDALKIPKSRIQKFKAVEEEDATLAKKLAGANQKKDNKKITQNLIEAIAMSKGKTLITFLTHGCPGGLTVGSDLFLTEQFADTLVTRWVASGEKDDLAQITIVSDACFSYDFAQNLVACIKYGLGKAGYSESEINQTMMPSVITTTHRGSVGWNGRGIVDSLHQQVEGIRKDTGLLLGRLMHLTQPYVYQDNDMTFFLPGRGKLDEIGRTKTVEKTKKS